MVTAIHLRHFDLSSNGEIIDPDKDILILDEIQAVPRALTALKYFCRDMPRLAVAAAAFNLGVTTISEPFPVGKIECFTLFPLNFEEFLLGTDEKMSLARFSHQSRRRIDKV